MIPRLVSRSLPAALALSAALTLAACGDSNEFDAARMSVTATGVGPITPDTRFDAVALTELLPGAVIVEDQDYSEGQPYDVIAVSDGGDPVITLMSDSDGLVGLVRVHDRRVRLRGGHGVGSVYSEVFSAQPAARCVAGMEELSGTVLCNAPGARNVQLVFAGAWDGPDGMLPPTEVVSGWRVREMIWRAY